MNLRYLFMLGTASLLIPMGSAIALSQTASQLIAATPVAAIAQVPQCPAPPPPPPMAQGRSGGNPEPPWAKDLNLSTEQQEQIAAIHEQARKEGEGLREQLMAADNQMRSLLASDAAPDRLRQQHQQIQALHQQLDNNRFETMLAERQVLTPEQRAQLGKLVIGNW
ncbi:MAG TPA: hypothetical protein DDZ80_16095 [Cyanobacteria bacterium UBA8803]|nr:hypothetical protein [Cyanobacteria bacterium UBA9273]HBL59937.1 hypothetical protein [Cyanobacteria bacterium UBA8803]